MNLFIFLSGPASFADLMLLVLLWILVPIALIYFVIKIFFAPKQNKSVAIDYWITFDNLVNTLRERNELAVAKDFEESKRFVNGTTGGNFAFLKEFKLAVDKNIELLNSDETTTAQALLYSLEETLRENNNT